MVVCPIEVPPTAGGPPPLCIKAERRADEVLSHNLHTTLWPTTHFTTVTASTCTCPWSNDCNCEGSALSTNEFTHLQSQQESLTHIDQYSQRYTTSRQCDFVSPSDLILSSEVPSFDHKDGSIYACGGPLKFQPDKNHPLAQEDEPRFLITSSDRCHETTAHSNRKHVSIIKAWLSEHASSPYPTHQQKEELITSTGISERQLNVCLSNLRARTIPRCADSSRSGLEARFNTTSGTNMATTGEPMQSGSYEMHEPWNEFSMDGSPSDGFSWVDLLDLTALAANATESSSSSPNSNAYNNLHIATAEAETVVTAQKHQSAKRKGKRRHTSRAQYELSPASIIDASVICPHSAHGTTNRYHCTKCTDSFKDSYAWRRHESGVHGYIDIQWVCTLQKNIIIDTKCIFCSDVVSDLDHFEQHNIRTCIGEDKLQRTFSRKDGLKQHVLQKHLTTANDYVRKGFEPPQIWSEQAEMSLDAKWCGFCLQSFETTTLRMKHVAQHFKDGCHMTDWIQR
ncbi:hypothetical protein T440DRAFT_553594 [Plenodomus tracheiphilus IPT5]|uniref:C2H2-type domain-containing protein n=1 Tax=Plenodomus tracheiphilus IPT5 TaxID=1408161 RepID=A0A6A7BBN4_9PLEO|nr:hypothetical protein T440DRAFT_553594 [Plenodomus tracheiphilus IPT5]